MSFCRQPVNDYQPASGVARAEETSINRDKTNAPDKMPIPLRRAAATIIRSPPSPVPGSVARRKPVVVGGGVSTAQLASGNASFGIRSPALVIDSRRNIPDLGGR